MNRDTAEERSQPMQRIERQAYKWAMKMADDPARHRAGLERWIIRSPEHLVLYNRVAREMRLATWSAGQLDLQPIETKRTSRLSVGGSHPVWAIAALTSVLSASGAAYLVFHTPKESGGPLASAAPAVSRSWSTHADDIRRTRLPDGSVVTLDRNSAISIRFAGDRRVVELARGRVRFEVAHDTSRPFVVQARGGSITATGTIFDVEVSDVVHVHLMRGGVEVATPAKTAGNTQTPVRLLPGQKLDFGAARQGAVPVPQAARAVDGQWVSGTMSFEDMPLADIIAQTNAYSGTRIAVSEPALLHREMFVDLDIRDADAVAHKLAMLLDLTVDRSQPEQLILRPR